MKFYKHRYVNVAAYVILALAITVAQVRISRNYDRANEILRQSNILGCERANDLRISINDQTLNFISSSQLNVRLFASVSAAIPKSASKTLIAAAAVDAQKIIKSYKPLPRIDCLAAFPKGKVGKTVISR
jgi:hypothetical protein